MKKPSMKNMRKQIERRSICKKFTIHIYSFKKYGFTKFADTLGDLAAHAIAGHKAYLITYCKKTGAERAEDFKKVSKKLELFKDADEEAQKLKQEITSSIDSLPKERLAEVLEALRRLRIAMRLFKRWSRPKKRKN